MNDMRRHTLIASMCHEVPREENNANGNLLAAAPELLDACKAVFDLMPEGLKNPIAVVNAYGYEFGQAYELVRSALAKAEGRV